MGRIKVLIVDDSIVFREALRRGLARDNEITVVGTAKDVYEARDMIVEHRPDVITLDIEMPKMNGIDFLKKLLPQYPVPVIVLSAIEEKLIEALEAGAVEFISKSSQNSPSAMETLISEMTQKVKIAAISKVKDNKDKYNTQGIEKPVNSELVLGIGASTGGTEAILSIVRNFPVDMIPTLIVQHMPPVFTKLYAERLNRDARVEVKEAEDGDMLRKGLVLVAPGDLHMSLEKRPKGYVVRCFDGEKMSGHKPSCDILFYSMAKCLGKKGIGVILTGMGQDGANGILALRKQGGFTIGQDEQSCVVYGMPKVAYDIGGIDVRAHLQDIPMHIDKRIRNLGN